MARIAVGGFQHETNSFAPTPTRLADFIAADGWPGLSRGEVLFDAVAGINSINPTAPRFETARVLKPDSTTMTARSKLGSTDAAAAAFSMMESY